MRFATEPEPQRESVLAVMPGVERIVADNPGPMTYHGTNTYLIDTSEGLMVLDPGPDHAGHIAAVARAAAGASAILVSHGHHDHCAGVERLRALLDVPVYGHAGFDSPLADIDIALAEGDIVGGMEVLHTPGHAPDHICLARGDGVVFTGDHVMGWSSSAIPYPGGDMAAFIANLERLHERGDRLYLSGHGPALENPGPFLTRLIASRRRREQEIVEALERGPKSDEELTLALYGKRGPRLELAAQNTVRSHLAKLFAEGRVREDARGWHAL